MTSLFNRGDNEFVRKLSPRTSGARGIVAIAAGTALGQVLAIGASPVISRLYSPADFGIFSIVNALAMVLGTVLALRYELAIPLPHSESDARSLVVLSALVTAATTLVISLALVPLSQPLADQIGEPGLGPWLPWVPVIGAAIVTFQLLNQWTLRQQRYRATARRNVVQSVSTVTLQIATGVRIAGPSGLIVGLAGGQAIGAVSLLQGSGLRGRVEPAALSRVARRYRSFPMQLAPAGFLNAVGLYLPVLLFAILYGAEVAGWLGFTQRILALPVALVGQAVAQVYMSELAQDRRIGSRRQYQLFRVASRRLAMFGMAGAVALLLLARPLFPMVFGQPWSNSGAMAQALALSLAVQFVASPLSQTLIVYEKTGLQLAWDTSRLVLVSAAIVVPSALGAGPLTAVWSMSIASALCYIASWLLSRRTLVQASRRLGALDSSDARHCP